MTEAKGEFKNVFRSITTALFHAEVEDVSLEYFMEGLDMAVFTVTAPDGRESIDDWTNKYVIISLDDLKRLASNAASVRGFGRQIAVEARANYERATNTVDRLDLS